MESLRELYRIGYGPSSSHTMGPRAAAEAFLKAHPETTEATAELYGSLAATGKGHLTDRAIREVFLSHSVPVEILWFPGEIKPFHLMPHAQFHGVPENPYVRLHQLNMAGNYSDA